MQGIIIFIVCLLQLFFIEITIGYTCKSVTRPSCCILTETPDYYWRDFHGDIPEDAVPAGRNSAGSTTYVGQAYIKDRELLPVSIYRDCLNGRTSAYFQELQPDKNIKILCSNDPSRLSWIPTTPATTPLIIDADIIVGGYEINEVLTIGRVNYNGEITIGKVFGVSSVFKGLWIPNNAGSDTNFQNYQILAYNISDNFPETEVAASKCKFSNVKYYNEFELNKIQRIIIVGLFQLFIIKTVIGFTCKVTTTGCTTPEILDYYWRDFYGSIPGDAVPGGTNIDGSLTYIGQAYIKDKELLPVTIYHGCINSRASAYNQELQTDKNIKILCSNDLSKFSWISTTPEKTPLLTNCRLPAGGTEVNQLLHIGRVNYNGEIIIGKVFSYRVGNQGLWIPNETGHETRFLNYEILAYNCLNKSTEITVAPQ